MTSHLSDPHSKLVGTEYHFNFDRLQAILCVIVYGTTYATQWVIVTLQSFAMKLACLQFFTKPLILSDLCKRWEWGR
jgi:hypothetical protein